MLIKWPSPKIPTDLNRIKREEEREKTGSKLAPSFNTRTNFVRKINELYINNEELNHYTSTLRNELQNSCSQEKAVLLGLM